MAEWGDFELTVPEHQEENVHKLMDVYRSKRYDFPESFQERFRDPHIPT